MTKVECWDRGSRPLLCCDGKRGRSETGDEWARCEQRCCAGEVGGVGGGVNLCKAATATPARECVWRTQAGRGAEVSQGVDCAKNTPGIKHNRSRDRVCGFTGVVSCRVNGGVDVETSGIDGVGRRLWCGGV